MAHSPILEIVKKRNPNEPEFLQAAQEVIESLGTVLERNPELARLKILERTLEPER